MKNKYSSLNKSELLLEIALINESHESEITAMRDEHDFKIEQLNCDISNLTDDLQKLDGNLYDYEFKYRNLPKIESLGDELRFSDLMEVYHLIPLEYIKKLQLSLYSKKGMLV